ncbi:hypothetical protein SUDANB120_04837 [Streptomyces sp. enrichment culture]|uniref:beta family protein n=1 Tax=Streptomyces sp. enrichment culture TaxID=1795815 RepID=UPI003F56A676
MSGSPYVPVLPAKPYARDAYRQLTPRVQAAVTPLWNLLPRTGKQPDELVSGVRQDVLAVSRVQRHRPGWIDAPFADEAQLSALAGVLSADAALSPLRPVTGPGRPEAYQAAVLGNARETGKGIGVRVGLTGEWDDAAAQGVRDLVARVDPAVEADLLLDLGAVRADRPDAAKEALRALDTLVPLMPWRTTAVLAGGFPDVNGPLMEDGTAVEPRWDWMAWRELHGSSRDHLRRLAYGDYGVVSPDRLAQPPGGGPATWGVLRYTTDASFVLVRVPRKGPDATAATRAAAAELCALPGFRGAAASAGETWLRDCACDRDGAGPGNFGTWLRTGSIQHMTYAVRSLRP